MAPMKTWFRGTAILLVLALTGPAYAKIRVLTIFELVDQSDVVFVGKVTAVGEETAIVAIDEMLSGKLTEGSVSVTPIHLQHCIGRVINFVVSEAVLIFGKKTDDKRVKVAAGGQGKIKLDPKKREMEIQAAKRMLAMAQLEAHERNKAMLAHVRSQNERLRSESHFYIASTLSHSKLRDQYKEALVSLVEDSDPDIQRTGLQGIRFVHAQDTIPRIAELTRSEDLGVVSAASLALGQYDSKESVAALITLMKHKNPQMRMRACIDMARSRRPEAKAALKRLLDDKDPKVRAMGPRGLVHWLRRHDADDILPRLVEMLKDADPGVRAAVADKLGEYRSAELVPPLMAALKKEQHNDNIKRSILRALYCHYSKGDATAKALIDNDNQHIVAALKSGGPNDALGSSFQAVGILNLSPKTAAKEALQWAARSHPSKEIRAYAKRCLSK